MPYTELIVGLELILHEFRIFPPFFAFAKISFRPIFNQEKNKWQKWETVRGENSKVGKVEIGRSANIEVEMNPQSSKLGGYDKRGPRDQYCGLVDPE